jgi:dienelactone hydrolase
MITERVTFESQDIVLGGRLTMPESGLAVGGIVCVTGGGVDHCDSSYLEWQSYMSQEGLATLSFNARGIGDSGGSWRTNSQDYDSVYSPANSQASRTKDLVNAYKFFGKAIELPSQSKLGVIGGSMGGDIATHALDLIEPGALVLRAPAAYPDEIHEMSYGPAWGARIKDLGGDSAALNSSNFASIEQSNVPMMLIYSRGESVVPVIVQERYKLAVARMGGVVLSVGDESTPHTYINDAARPEKDTASSAKARQQTFEEATRFFKENLVV